jgi:hypothetical protein
MRGVPQSGFSRLIFRISLRISFDTGGRPRWPRRTFQVQNSRNPLRCQAMMVPGLTMQRAERHSAEAPPKPSPQEPVEPVQSWLFDRALHHAKLVAESQDLKLQRRSSAEDRHYGREQCR